MRRYETIFITHPELTEEDHAGLQEKLRSIMANLKGDLLKIEDWGLKKLSFQIRKNNRGHYFLLDYLAAPNLVRELERNLRLNDRVLKYLTVKIAGEISAEGAKALRESAPAEQTIKVSNRVSAPEVRTRDYEEKAEPEGGDAR